MSATRTAVLIHGLHLESRDWERMVWGNPRVGAFGRASLGILEAHKRDASLIFWGTGASEKDGKKESAYTVDYAISRLDQLGSPDSLEVQRLRGLVVSRSYVDLETQNTVQEVMAAINLCRSEGIDEITLVSNPSHLPRCYRDACVAAKALHHPIRIYTLGADTSYPNEDMSDVVIIEPPHRPDRAAPSFNRVLKRIFPFYQYPELADALATDFDALLNEYERRLG